MVETVLWLCMALATFAIGFGLGQSYASSGWRRIATACSSEAIRAQNQADLYRGMYEQTAMMLDIANKRLDGDGPTQIYVTPLPSSDLEEFEELGEPMVDRVA